MAQVAGYSVVVTATPTISSAATAYAANDQIGDIQTLEAGHPARARGMVVLQSFTLVDAGKQNAEIDVLFFNSHVTAVADNAAADFSDASLKSCCVGHITVTSYDYVDVASASVACLRNVGLMMEPAQSSTVYAVPVTRGTPTYTSASDLIFKYGFAQDL